MALVTHRISDTLTQKARSKLGIRFGRFTIAAIAAVGDATQLGQADLRG